MVKTDTYDPARFSQLFAAEDRHFWFRARNRVIRGFLKEQSLGDLPSGFGLEIGCGTGVVLKSLARAFPNLAWIGADLHADGLSFARRRVARPLVQMDALAPPFRSVFDLVGLFDVIEHLDDDLATLRSAARLLAPGGLLIVTVPAYPWLWSHFDVAARHKRRYTRRTLAKALADAGLEPLRMSYFMLPTLPLVYLHRWLSDRKSDAADGCISAELSPSGFVNGALGVALAPESTLLKLFNLPFGSSLIATARKS